MAYGLTTTGFKRKRLADILEEMKSTARATFGANINLQPNSILMQLLGIYAERESLIWELAEAVYYSQYPDTAEGVNLDNIASISGVTRLPAQPSRINSVQLKGDVGTTVPAGTTFSVEGNPAARFRSDGAVTLIAGQDEVQTLTFGATPDSGSFRLSHLGSLTDEMNFSSTAQDLEDALNALPYLSTVLVTGSFAAGFVITFQDEDGKIDQPLLVVEENTLTEGGDAVSTLVTQTTAGIPQGSVNVTADVDGPTDAPIYTLIVIDTPVTGLDAVLNLNEVILGRNEETDGEYRIRRIESLQRAGSSTVEAIRARLLEIQEVDEVVIFENITMDTDSNGLPPKSFKAFVQGGDNQEVADAIWLNKPAGIETFGDITSVVVDSQGVNQTVKFSRPVEVPIYITIEITKDTSPLSQWATVTGPGLVKEALAAYISTLKIGQDVIVYPKLVAALNSIAGIDDLEIGVGTAPAPALGADANVVIDSNEIAIIDIDDITVTVVP